tara:strand:+ start:1711 stop:3582 length:1872 start_codon:yes stop_codon:yes gene_type:complete
MPDNKSDSDNQAGLDKQLDNVVANFEEWEEQTRDARTASERSRDYFDGKQWTDKEKQLLDSRNQPAHVDNKLKDKLEYIVGMEAASRTDPKAYPRTPDDEDASEAATDSLRFIADNNDLDTKASDAFENIVIEGYGGCEIEVEKVGKQIQVTINQSPWDRMYYQPYSRRKDFSDARYRGIFVWMDEEQAKEDNPEVDWDSVMPMMTEGENPYESSGDKPSNIWYERSSKRIRVVQQYYHWKGKLCHCKFVKGAWIEEPSESKYLDEDGLPEDPYAWMSAYVDRENNRYGVSRRYEDLQDAINHRKSKASHIMNSNQIIAEEGAVASKSEARKQANMADGYIEINPNFTFSIDKNMELSIGQAQLLQQDLEALATTGPKAVSNTSASQSGRAKQFDNQTDVIEMGRLLDQHRAFKRQIYRKVWNRVKQFWTDERWVRITDDEGAPKFVQLNKPVTNLEQAEMLGEKMQAGEIDQQELQQSVMLAMTNPDGIARKQNNVGELDVDIILDDAPDMVNLQSEQFQGLVTLAQAGVVFPQETYIEASSLRNKDRLLEKLTGGDDPQQQAALQAEQQLSQQERMVKLQELTGKAEKSSADARKANADAASQELENQVAQAAVEDLAANG